jgi:hypothetical protein
VFKAKGGTHILLCIWSSYCRRSVSGLGGVSDRGHRRVFSVCEFRYRDLNSLSETAASRRRNSSEHTWRSAPSKRVCTIGLWQLLPSSASRNWSIAKVTLRAHLHKFESRHGILIDKAARKGSTLVSSQSHARAHHVQQSTVTTYHPVNQACGVLLSSCLGTSRSQM